MGRIIDVYLDTEKVKCGSDWKLSEIGVAKPSGREGNTLFGEKIRLKVDDTSKRILKDVVQSMIDFINEDVEKDDTIVIAGWNVETADIGPLLKVCDQYNIEWPTTHTVDLLPIAKRVLKLDKHDLQSVRQHLSVAPWDQHTALPDAKGTFEVAKVLMQHVDRSEFFKVALDDEDGKANERAANMLLESTSFIPLYLSLSLSGECELKDKESRALPVPCAVKVTAFCPSNTSKPRFTSLIKPPEGVEVDPRYSDGVTPEELKDAPTFKKVYKDYRQWQKLCLGGDATARLVQVTFSGRIRDALVFDREIERLGKQLPKNVIWFHLNALKNTGHRLLPWYKEEEFADRTEQSKSWGFQFEPKPVNGRDAVFDELIHHFGIPHDLNRLEKTKRLFELMTKVPDQSGIKLGMLKNEKRFVAVARAIKTAYVAHPIFVKIHTTEIERTEKRLENGKKKKEINAKLISIEAYAPNKTEGDNYYHAIVNPGGSVRQTTLDELNLTKKDLSKAPTWEEEAPYFWDWVGQGKDSSLGNRLPVWEKVILMTHGATFLRTMLWKNGPVRADLQYFCTQNLAQGLYGRGKDVYSMEALTERFGLDNQNDVYTIYNVFQKMIEPMEPDESYPLILERVNKKSSLELRDQIKALENKKLMILCAPAIEKKAMTEQVVKKPKKVRRSARLSKKAGQPS